MAGLAGAAEGVAGRLRLARSTTDAGIAAAPVSGSEQSCAGQWRGLRSGRLQLHGVPGSMPATGVWSAISRWRSIVLGGTSTSSSTGVASTPSSSWCSTFPAVLGYPLQSQLLHFRAQCGTFEPLFQQYPYLR